MHPSTWSTHQLAEFLAVVSSSETEASAALAAVERAAEALNAEVAAIVCGGELVAAVGYPEGAVPVAELDSLSPGGADNELAVPGVGVCPATAVCLEHPPGATLILARCGPGGLSGEEASLLRGMARVTLMTMRILRLLDDERAAREHSDRQTAEVARLLDALTERQALLERLAEEQAALRRVATLVAGQAPAEDIFAAVAEEVGRLLRADMGAVCRYESDGSVSLVASWSEAGIHIPVGTRTGLEGGNVSAMVLQSRGPARLDSYEGLCGPLAALLREHGIRSSVGAPIVVDGRVWGSMIASSNQPKPFPTDSEQRLAAFTELVATAISNAQARSDLARLAQEQAALRRVATLVARGVPPAEVFAAVTEEVGRLLGLDLTSMLRFEPDETATVVARLGWKHEESRIGDRWALESLLAFASVRRTGRSARVDDTSQARGRLADLVREEGIQCMVASPIGVEGHLWGAIGVGSRPTDAPRHRAAHGGFHRAPRHRGRERGKPRPADSLTGAHCRRLRRDPPTNRT